jgi:hypothetical protein
LKNAIQKIIEHSLSSINESIVKRTATESLARAALQAPAEQPTQAVFGNSASYEQYQDSSPNSAEPNINVSNATYSGLPYQYSNTSSTAVTPSHQQGTYPQQVYNNSEETALPPSHAAALQATATTQSINGTYAYSSPQVATGSYPSQFSANGVTPTDWHQWSRSSLQQMGAPGEYLNSANTLLTLGSREGTQGPGGPAQMASMVEASPLQGPTFTNSFQWPRIMFNAGPNGQVDQQ